MIEPRNPEFVIATRTAFARNTLSRIAAVRPWRKSVEVATGHPLTAKKLPGSGKLAHKVFTQKMVHIAGLCASYLQPLESVERWSLLDSRARKSQG